MTSPLYLALIFFFFTMTVFYFTLNFMYFFITFPHLFSVMSISKLKAFYMVGNIVNADSHTSL